MRLSLLSRSRRSHPPPPRTIRHPSICSRLIPTKRLAFLSMRSIGPSSPAATAQAPEEGYSREQLLPLTKFRQQHRRTIDGRLCAAAFVQNRKSYTGCTDAPSPSGESGRAWCYVEAQVLCVYTSNNACPVKRNTYSSWWIQVAAKQRGIIVVSMLCALGCACCFDFCDVRSSRIDTCTCAFTLQRGI